MVVGHGLTPVVHDVSKLLPRLCYPVFAFEHVILIGRAYGTVCHATYQYHYQHAYTYAALLYTHSHTDCTRHGLLDA